MSVKTAHKYERAGKLPSQLKRPPTWRSRPNPFEADGPWVGEPLERDPAVQATTRCAVLGAMQPGKYRPTQRRTLQRHIATWRALHGPEQDVIFEQGQLPGERAQADFPPMEDLGITLAGQPFPPLLLHLVLTDSTVEAVQICFGEPLEALAEGIEHALWQIGGVPTQHRTDHVSAAIHHLPSQERETFSERSQALMRQYRMEPTGNTAGIAQENGDVEPSPFRFKQAVDQALRVRGSRDLVTRLADQRFLEDLVRQRTPTRQARFAQERTALRPLPTVPRAPGRELRLTLSRFSTMTLLGTGSCVPSGVIGTMRLVRVRAETLEGSVGSRLTFTLPPLHGRGQHAITSQQLIWSLVRETRALLPTPAPVRPSTRP